jgi:lipid kinase YegS
MTMRLILNGKGAADPAVREAVRKIRNLGHSIEVRVTWEAGDAARLADEARSDGVDILVAGGGDGTLNEVTNGLFKADDAPSTALGILPLGTANDFATSCGIPTDPFEALMLVTEGKPAMIDVAKANDCLFLNVASGGFGAEVTASTPPEMKRILGGGAYSLVGIVTAVKMRPYHGKMIWAGGEESDPVILMAIGNGRQAGGGYKITPKAFINDGLLDVMAIRDFPMRDLGIVLNELQNLGKAEGQYVYYKQMPSLEVEATDEVPLNLDGEPTRIKSAKFEVLKQRLPVILPTDTPLLLSSNVPGT